MPPYPPHLQHQHASHHSMGSSQYQQQPPQSHPHQAHQYQHHMQAQQQQQQQQQQAQHQQQMTPFRQHAPSHRVPQGGSAPCSPAKPAQHAAPRRHVASSSGAQPAQRAYLQIPTPTEAWAPSYAPAQLQHSSSHHSSHQQHHAQHSQHHPQHHPQNQHQHQHQQQHHMASASIATSAPPAHQQHHLPPPRSGAHLHPPPQPNGASSHAMAAGAQVAHHQPSLSGPQRPPPPQAEDKTGGLSPSESDNAGDAFHVMHKVPQGDTPYVRAKQVQLVEKDLDRAIALFWSAINAGDRVDSALKDMAIVMKQQNRAEEAIEAIKSLRHKCSDQAQESLDNVLLDLYKRCGRLDDQISLLKHKLDTIRRGVAFNSKRTKTARSQGKKFQVSIEQEATRLLGNLGWAYMQQSNFEAAEYVYRKALSIEPDNNKVCNLGICLMKQGRVEEARTMLRAVTPVGDPRWGSESHLKSFERAQEMLREIEAQTGTLVPAPEAMEGTGAPNEGGPCGRGQGPLAENTRARKDAGAAPAPAPKGAALAGAACSQAQARGGPPCNLLGAPAKWDSLMVPQGPAQGPPLPAVPQAHERGAGPEKEKVLPQTAQQEKVQGQGQGQGQAQQHQPQKLLTGTHHMQQQQPPQPQRHHGQHGHAHAHAHPHQHQHLPPIPEQAQAQVSTVAPKAEGAPLAGPHRAPDPRALRASHPAPSLPPRFAGTKAHGAAPMLRPGGAPMPLSSGEQMRSAAPGQAHGSLPRVGSGGGLAQQGHRGPGAFPGQVVESYQTHMGQGAPGQPRGSATSAQPGSGAHKASQQLPGADSFQSMPWILPDDLKPGAGANGALAASHHSGRPSHAVSGPSEVPLNRAVSYPAARMAQRQQHPAAGPTLSHQGSGPQHVGLAPGPGPRGGHAAGRPGRAPGEAPPAGEAGAYHKLMEHHSEGMVASPRDGPFFGGYSSNSSVVSWSSSSSSGGYLTPPTAEEYYYPLLLAGGAFHLTDGLPRGMPALFAVTGAPEGSQQGPPVGGAARPGVPGPEGLGMPVPADVLKQRLEEEKAKQSLVQPSLEAPGAGMPKENPRGPLSGATRGSQAAFPIGGGAAKEVPGAVQPLAAGSRLQATAAPFPDPSKALVLAPGASRQPSVVPASRGNDSLYGYSQGELSGLGMPVVHQGKALSLRAADGAPTGMGSGGELSPVALGTKRNRVPTPTKPVPVGWGLAVTPLHKEGGASGHSSGAPGDGGADDMRKSWEQLGFTGSPGLLDLSALCPGAASPAEGAPVPAAGAALPMHPLAQMTKATAMEAAGEQGQGSGGPDGKSGVGQGEECMGLIPEGEEDEEEGEEEEEESDMEMAEASQGGGTLCSAGAPAAGSPLGAKSPALEVKRRRRLRIFQEMTPQAQSAASAARV